MTITERSVVIVARDLVHGAPITVTVSDAAVGITMTLADFLTELSTAYGGVATTLTQAQHAAKLVKAAELVVTDMKLATAKVM